MTIPGSICRRHVLRIFQHGFNKKKQCAVLFAIGCQFMSHDRKGRKLKGSTCFFVSTYMPSRHVQAGCQFTWTVLMPTAVKWPLFRVKPGCETCLILFQILNHG